MTPRDQIGTDGSPGTGAAGPRPRLFDADSHYYETADSFVAHLAPADRERADALLRAQGDEPLSYARQEVAAPGAMRRNLRRMASGDAQGDQKTWRSPAFSSEKIAVRPEFIDRDARLTKLDEQGVEGSLLFPSRANMLEFYLESDVDTTYATLRSFNEWLDATWGFARDGRLFAAAQVSMLDPQRAVTEVDWLLGKGVRALNLRPGPFGKKSPGDPVFDPFWARCEEAGLLVCFHASNVFSYVPKFYGDCWDEHGFGSSFMYVIAGSDRQIMDTLAALVLHNVFGRFPELRVAAIEHGAYWVPYLLKIMDKAHAFYRLGPALGGQVMEKPSAIFKRHIWSAPFHEEDGSATVELLGSTRVLLGSDFPHSEGVAEPEEMLSTFARTTGSDLEHVAYDNIRELLALT